MKNIVIFFKKISTLLAQALASIFGSIDYNRPFWLEKIRQFGQKLKLQYPLLISRLLKSFLGIALVSLVFGVGYFLYEKYRPQPRLVTVKLSGPYFPDFAKPEPQGITLRFSDAVARVDMIGKNETQYVKIKPQTDGAWVWTNDKELTFTPNKSATNPFGWVLGEDYSVKIDDRFFPKGWELKESEVKVEMAKLEARAGQPSLYRDPLSPKIQRGTFSVNFNFPMDIEDLRRRVKITMVESQVALPTVVPIKFETSANEDKTTLFVVTENLKAPEADSKIIFELAEGGVGAWSGKANNIQMELAVPGRNSLTVRRIALLNVRNELFQPEQVLTFDFSLPVAGSIVNPAVEVFLLPIHKNGNKKITWTSTQQLDTKILAEAKKIDLSLHATIEEESQTQSFKVKAPENRQLYIKVAKGIKNAADYFMPEEYSQIVNTGEAPKEIMMMGQGALLSLSGEKKIPLLSRNIKAIQADFYRLLPEQLVSLTRQTFNYGSFQKPNLYESILWDTTQKIEKSISIESPTNKSANNPASSAVNDEAASDTHYSTLNLDQVLKTGERGLFYVKLLEKKKIISNQKNGDESQEHETSERDGSVFDERLILVTDLGLVIKKNFSKSYSLFVQNLKSGAPSGQTKIQVLGRNGLSVFETITDESGRAEIPSLAALTKEKAPSLFVASKGEDFVFMPVDQNDRLLDYSKFDIGGIFESSDSDQLIAYLFSDRGIYRPGEDVKLGLIVRHRQMNKINKDLPLEMTVTDPRGQVVEKKLIKVSTDNLSDFSWTSQPDSPTGSYLFQLSIPKSKQGSQLVGSVEVRVEEFVPDELSIFSSFGLENIQGWLTAPISELKLSVKNLYGTPASERTIETKLTVTPIQPFFRKYLGFRFSFNNKNNLGMEENLATGVTDSAGELNQSIDLSKLSEGFYQVRLDSQAMQAGSGRAVYSRIQSFFSTIPYLIGYKTESDLNYLTQKSPSEIELIAIGQTLEKLKVENLKINLYQIQYLSSLIKQPNGLFKYQSVRKDKQLSSEKLVLNDSENKLKMRTSDVGDFYYLISDDKDRGLVQIDFSVIGDGSEQRGLEKASELKLTLNKKDFLPESEIEIEIRAPFAGSGLITIEREKIFAHKWFKSNTATSVQKIKIPAGLEGFAYVNVSYLRDINSKQIYMNPLSYAVENFSISLDARKNKLQVQMKDLVKPGAQLNIEYSSQQPTSLILYGINEGILQVAKYLTPNPIDFFFKRRALQVKTFQILDLLRPEFSVLKEVSGVGGDMDGSSFNPSLNPFKRKTDPPVVFWSGVLQSGPKSKVFTYKVPDFFNGSIRIIAVSADSKTFGQVNQQVVVRGDLILTPTAPFFVAPGDEFESSVTIANQKKNSGPNATVKIDVKTQHAEVVGESNAVVAIPEGQEKNHIFRFKAKNNLGAGEIVYFAEFENEGSKSSTREKFERRLGYSLRPASVFRTTFVTEFVKDILKIPNNRSVFTEFSKAEVVVSALPFSFVGATSDFLTNYEYLCSEQLMSRALGLIVMNKMGFDLLSRTKNKIDLKSEITKIINLLKARQNPDGGLGLYPLAQSSSFLSPYFFLLKEKMNEAGLAIPGFFVDGLTKYATEITSSDNSSDGQKRVDARQIYWLTVEGKLVTQKLLFLAKISGKSEDPVLNAYLAGAFTNTKMMNEAETHWKKVKLQNGKNWNDYDFASTSSLNSEVLYLVSKHKKDILSEWTRRDDFKIYFADILNGGLQTHSASWSMIAALEILTILSKDLKVSGFQELSTDPKKPLVFSGKLIKKSLTDALAKSVQVTTNEPIWTTFSVSGFNDTALSKEEINGIEAKRVYLVNGIETTKMKLGDEVTVQIRLKATDGKSISNIAWVDLLPGGLEPQLNTVVFGEATDIREQEPVPEDGLEGEGEGESEPPAENDSESGEHFHEKSKVFARFSNYSFFVPQVLAQSNAPQNTTQLPIYRPQYVDRREDRLVFYGYAPSSTMEMTYKAKAVAVGKFIVPSFFGENMYDPQVYYLGAQSQIEVSR